MRELMLFLRLNPLPRASGWQPLFLSFGSHGSGALSKRSGRRDTGRNARGRRVFLRSAADVAFVNVSSLGPQGCMDTLGVSGTSKDGESHLLAARFPHGLHSGTG